MQRRTFLKGMAGILAAAVAPAYIGSKILMPVRELVVPNEKWFTHGSGNAWVRLVGVDMAGNERDFSTIVTGKQAPDGTVWLDEVRVVESRFTFDNLHFAPRP